MLCHDRMCIPCLMSYSWWISFGAVTCNEGPPQIPSTSEELQFWHFAFCILHFSSWNASQQKPAICILIVIILHSGIHLQWACKMWNDRIWILWNARTWGTVAFVISAYGLFARVAKNIARTVEPEE